MRVKLDDGAFEPERAHADDAGLDIKSMESGVIYAGKSETFHTGVHVELPENTVGVLLPKSGLMCKHDIITFGVIDEGFRGEILVHAFNLGNEDYEVEIGDKLSQMLILPVFYERVELVNELSDSSRGSKGFGSSGR